ncbi:hypothetical protein LEP1GSC061_2530 [Leptospira wolffii serovar Khorat str. Khorat-H2]|nr:hypothetical protein LEP1GSC061_2530 [Leptospira wolffii serovar Khorat str. Khorat-H2]
MSRFFSLYKPKRSKGGKNVRELEDLRRCDLMFGHFPVHLRF